MATLPETSTLKPISTSEIDAIQTFSDSYGKRAIQLAPDFGKLVMAIPSDEIPQYVSSIKRSIRTSDPIARHDTVIRFRALMYYTSEDYFNEHKEEPAETLPLTQNQRNWLSILYDKDNIERIEELNLDERMDFVANVSREYMKIHNKSRLKPSVRKLRTEMFKAIMQGYSYQEIGDELSTHYSTAYVQTKGVAETLAAGGLSSEKLLACIDAAETADTRTAPQRTKEEEHAINAIKRLAATGLSLTEAVAKYKRTQSRSTNDRGHTRAEGKIADLSQRRNSKVSTKMPPKASATTPRNVNAGSDSRSTKCPDVSTSFLFRRAQAGDKLAENILAEKLSGLANSLARKYARGHPENLEELTLVANYGLAKAIKRFDISRGVAFSTFAVPTIAGEIKRYFRDHGWAIHVPRALQERILDIKKARKTLEQTSPSGTYTTQEIADHLNLTLEEVIEAEYISRTHSDVASLNAPLVSDEIDSATLESTVPATTSDNPVLEEVDARIAIQQVLAHTQDPRDREIVARHILLDQKQADIAEAMSLSQIHISRHLRRILEEQHKRIVREEKRLAS